MSSTPLVFPGAGPALAVGPAPSASSRQDHWADPISRSSSSQCGHTSLTGEADNVGNMLGHAARLAGHDADLFPTVYNTSAATFPHSQLTIASLLAKHIGWLMTSVPLLPS